MMMMFVSRFYHCMLLLLLVLLASPSVQAFHKWHPPRGGATESPPTYNTTETFSSSSSSWSSYSYYATIDPSTILSLLIKKAGFFLDPQLPLLADLMHCEEAKLNVLDRQLLIRNFTVSLPNSSQYPALRIGRILVSWDSYSQPCLEIQVENVDVLVEFTNLIFSRNNWNELNDLGFPPDMIYYYNSSTTTTANTNSTTDSEFLRIGSLDLKGKVVLQTRSRPLQKAIAQDIAIDLQTLQDLKYQVKALAETNQMKVGRRGCTSDEIYELFSAFFQTKVKQAIRYAIEDLATTTTTSTAQSSSEKGGGDDSGTTKSSTSQLINTSKQVLASAKATLVEYAQNVESFSKGTIKKKLQQQINVQQQQQEGQDDEDQMPPPPFLKDEEMDQLVSESLDAIKSTIRLVGVKVLRNILQPRNNTATNTQTVFDDEILFADW